LKASAKLSSGFNPGSAIWRTERRNYQELEKRQAHFLSILDCGPGSDYSAGASFDAMSDVTPCSTAPVRWSEAIGESI
jgi:hypothetical protein